MFVLAGFDVIKPDPGLMFWTTLIFCLFWFIVGKYGFRPIANALKKREDDIQSALDEAKKSREEMANMQAENENLLAKAREERAQMIKEAKDTKNDIINEAKDKAKIEAQKIASSAMVEIENQKKAAMVDVKNKVGVMALDIAEKVLKKELKGNSEQEAFVNSLVEDIKLN
jgi:F-type H+-transporting ATPase subunit b